MISAPPLSPTSSSAAPSAATSAFILPPVLAEGRSWLVIDKPAGLAVHPGPKTPDSLEDILPRYTPSRPVPQPVHRLDRDTSGCLLLAKRKSALRELSADFAAGNVGKVYWAIVVNPPAAESGFIDRPLLKYSTKAEGWKIIPDARGKAARTAWRILSRIEETALIEFRPETGRTHQIRAHACLLSEGSAILGDPVYGKSHPAGMMLHARELSFPEPGEAENARNTINVASSPVPDRFKSIGYN